MATPLCPELKRWKHLLAGALSEAEQNTLCEHLETCVDCQQSFDRLTAAGDSWNDLLVRLRHLPVDENVNERDRTNAVSVKAASSVDPQRSESGDPDFDYELLRGLLAPSNDSNLLGRLRHYDVIGVVGHGGMGIVLKAIDTILKRVVAIKVLTPALTGTASGRKRFIREAQAVAAVRDEHVIAIYAVEEAAGRPYLVMEFVDGISLQERIDRTGPLELSETLRIGMQTAKGLAAAHVQGVIHRDIKPANILLENGVEQVKITDFGLARVVDDAGLSQGGLLAGTPQYMSPEQCRGEPVDHRSDLFSLGSVLYAACTGCAPFRAPFAMAVLRRVCDDEPRPIEELRPEIPDWLVAVVRKLHAKDPADRFQSAEEVAELLDSYSAHLQDPSQSPLPDTLELVPHRSDQSNGRAISLQRRPLAIATLLLVALGALGIAEWSGFTQLTSAISDRFAETPKAQIVPVGEVRRFEGHIGNVWSVAFSPDERLAVSGGYDHTARVWDLETGEELRRFGGACGRVKDVSFSHDGRHVLAACADGTIRLWDVDTGEEVRRFVGHEVVKDGVWTARFSPDGNLIASGGMDGTVRLWDVESGEPLHVLKGHVPYVFAVTFTPDGRRLLSGSGWGGPPNALSDNMVRVWDVATGEELDRIELSDPIEQLHVLPDGRRVVIGMAAAHGMFLWDMEKGEVVHDFSGHKVWTLRLAVSADGRRMITGSHDRHLHVWDVDSGQIVTKLEGPTAGNSVAISADGLQAISGSQKPDSTVRLWRLPPRE